MSESTRPSMQAVQRSLLIGILAGVLLGCILGTSLGAYYAWYRNPAVYAEGAQPKELTNGYQNHYLAMTIDSYIINQDVQVVQERLKTFTPRTKVLALGQQAAAYVEAGRSAEAQLINNLAVNLKGSEGWPDEVIKGVVSELSTQYQPYPARLQAINTFSAQLLGGQVPIPAALPTQLPPDGSASGGRSRWPLYVACCFLTLALLLIVYLLGKRRFAVRKAPTKKPIIWEQEGPPPLKQWSVPYTFGEDNYDEFFTIETDAGDFLGESGMAILDVMPGSSPKQVRSFDVGLFDKTDITTISRWIMTEHAFNDPAIQAKVEANSQAEAVLAELGKEFVFETGALRVACKIDELEYGPGNVYFNKLKLTMNLFLKEGVDLRLGEMDVPDRFKE